MNLYDYLSNDDDRIKLSKYIHDNMPELLECDPNNHTHDTICFLKCLTFINKDESEYYFSLVLIDQNEINKQWRSYQNLYNIRKDDYDLKDIEHQSIICEWGFKMGEGLKYPNLGLKFKNLITTYFRNLKLERLQNL